MERDSELYDLLHWWHEDAVDEFIDPYEVAEDRIPPDREDVQVALHELDAWMAATTEQERYDEIDTNDWMPFGVDEVEPFLAALRARLVEGLWNDEPAPLASPPERLEARDRREGPYPELLRLARYVQAHVSGEVVSPWLPTDADALTVTSMRLRELAELYHERILRELSAMDDSSGLGWGPEVDVADWLELVELIARYRVQRLSFPMDVDRDELDELRAEAAG